MLGWPNRCKLAYAFLREYSYRRLELAQLLGQLGGLSHLVGPGVRAVRQEEHEAAGLGSGRFVASEIDAPNLLANLVGSG